MKRETLKIKPIEPQKISDSELDSVSGGAPQQPIELCLRCCKNNSIPGLSYCPRCFRELAKGAVAKR